MQIHLFCFLTLWNLKNPAHSILIGKARANNASILFTSCAFARFETSICVPIVCLACWVLPGEMAGHLESTQFSRFTRLTIACNLPKFHRLDIGTTHARHSEWPSGNASRTVGVDRPGNCEPRGTKWWLCFKTSLSQICIFDTQRLQSTKKCRAMIICGPFLGLLEVIASAVARSQLEKQIQSQKNTCVDQSSPDSSLWGGRSGVISALW